MNNIYISVNPEIRDDYLEHGFKYVKRYKVNGKWRYVYADKKTHTSIRNAGEKMTAYSQAATMAAKRSDASKKWADRLSKIGNDKNRGTVARTIGSELSKRADTQYSKYKDNERAAKGETAQYQALVNTYELFGKAKARKRRKAEAKTSGAKKSNTYVLSSETRKRNDNSQFEKANRVSEKSRVKRIHKNLNDAADRLTKKYKSKTNQSKSKNKNTSSALNQRTAYVRKKKGNSK